MTDAEYSRPSQVVIQRDQRIERQLLHRVAMQLCSPEVNAAWARTLERVLLLRATRAAGSPEAGGTATVTPLSAPESLGPGPPCRRVPRAGKPPPMWPWAAPAIALLSYDLPWWTKKYPRDLPNPYLCKKGLAVQRIKFGDST
jgi:hypothetical protein